MGRYYSYAIEHHEEVITAPKSTDRGIAAVT